MAGTGYAPWAVMKALFEGSFGNIYTFANTLVIFIPLALIGVGVAIGFKGGVFNIGGEGQYWMGGVTATWLGTIFARLATPLHLALVLAGATAAGLLFALLPALLKAYRGVHEVVTTLMLSYAAIYFAEYTIEAGGPLSQSPVTPQSAPLASTAVLAPIVPTTDLSATIFVACGGIVLGAWLLYRTRFGFALRVVGKNARAAQVAGISARRVTVLALCLSGAYAGLAGGLYIVGVSHQLLDSFVDQYGFTAIVVALLARNNPWAVVPAALLFAALETGGNVMQANANIPATLSDVIQGLIIMFVVADQLVPFLWAKRRVVARLPRQVLGMLRAGGGAVG
jgi:simple sugar transport system permease protein